MANETLINWADSTWNPISGCNRVSPGCVNCYAEAIAEKLRGSRAFPNGFDISLRPEKLDLPTRWKKPRLIFVNSMSDFFHEKIPRWYKDRMWDVMMSADHHTYQVLTKRPKEMMEYVNSKGGAPEHVWVGISTENQEWYEKRVPFLWQTKAKVRFLSCEPLLGPIDLTGVKVMENIDPTQGIHWVITGGESGRPERVRPANHDWFRGIRDQCASLGIAYLHKQHGGSTKCPCHKEWGCRVLDGVVHDGFPAGASKQKNPWHPPSMTGKSIRFKEGNFQTRFRDELKAANEAAKKELEKQPEEDDEDDET